MKDRRKGIPTRRSKPPELTHWWLFSFLERKSMTSKQSPKFNLNLTTIIVALIGLAKVWLEHHFGK
jgi:hypothetical protein